MSEAEKLEDVPIEEPKVEEPPQEITKKDPRRVEQGKRLAAISKEAKEKKMRERIKSEEFSYLPFVGYAVSILSTFGIFYLLFSGQKDDPHPMTIIREESPKKAKSPKKRKFEGLG